MVGLEFYAFLTGRNALLLFRAVQRLHKHPCHLRSLAVRVHIGPRGLKRFEQSQIPLAQRRPFLADCVVFKQREDRFNFVQRFVVFAGSH